VPHDRSKHKKKRDGGQEDEFENNYCIIFTNCTFLRSFLSPLFFPSQQKNRNKKNDVDRLHTELASREVRAQGMFIGGVSGILIGVP
jgi:hypothetical protein